MQRNEVSLKRFLVKSDLLTSPEDAISFFQAFSDDNAQPMELLKQVMDAGIQLWVTGKGRYLKKGILLIRVTIRVEFAQSSLPAILECHRNAFAHFFVQARATMFAYCPILKRLQRMKRIPFSDELMTSPPISTRSSLAITLPTSVEAALQADPSQLAAAKLALTQRAFLQSMPSVRILCLCYTNHALDSFLESLLDNGVSKYFIIRLGSKTRISNRMRERCYQNIETLPFSGHAAQEHFSLKERMDAVERTLELLARKHIYKERLVSASNFLKSSSDQKWAYEQLAISDRAAGGMHTVGKGGKEVVKDYLWRKWLQGNPLPAAFATPMSSIRRSKNV
eukprot:gene29142-35172_t